MSSILNNVRRPEDLDGLTVADLEQLASEIRELIIDTVSRTGGHLAPNLGVVELTIALLRIFHPPTDKIVWDVSHQTYAYKILTDRKARFGTLRQRGGVSGYLRRDESEYDAFGAGHSGTAISAALGMAAARDKRGGGEHVVVVLGDGSLGCGISLEAFNNVVSTTDRLIVILNDNEMSISANVGATARYLGQLLTNPRYNRWKASVEHIALRLRLGWLRRSYYRLEEAIKSFFLGSVIFEELGLRYIGPIDGHNIGSLLDALLIARNYDRPIVVHVSTQKGKGYSFAEAHPEKWHGTPSFDVAAGKPLTESASPSYSDVLGATLERLARKDERIVAITAAMRSGTGLTHFAEQFPERFYDVGICEEHAVVFAAGLATEGVRPFFAVYSTFAQRAVDYIIHDVCLQKLPVTICLDRAGIVGADGPTHHGVFDIALLRPVPNLIFAQPKDEAELGNLLFSALRWEAPAAIRYPRGAGTGVPMPGTFEEIKPGKAEVIREGREIQIWALGDMVVVAEAAAELLQAQGLTAGVVNARFIRPMDTQLLGEQQAEARLVVTLENGVLSGGFGSGVEDFLSRNGSHGTVLKFGWPDEFVPHGKPRELMEQYGLTPQAIARAVSSTA